MVVMEARRAVGAKEARLEAKAVAQREERVEWPQVPGALPQATEEALQEALQEAPLAAPLAETLAVRLAAHLRPVEAHKVAEVVHLRPSPVRVYFFQALKCLFRNWSLQTQCRAISM